MTKCLFSRLFFKKNLNAPRPSEHPPVRGGMSKRVGGIIGCKYKTSSWYSNYGFPYGSNMGSTNSIMSGRSPTLYCTLTINRHAGIPDKEQKQNRNNVVQHPTW